MTMVFLEQPHTSSGRTPTDKGYRHFVDYLMSDEDAEDILAVHKKIIEIRRKRSEAFQELVREIAGTFNIFTAVAFPGREVYSAGIDEIFKEPEFKEYDVSRSFAGVLESLSDVVRDYYSKSDEEIRVYIGKENPFPFGAYFGSVFGRIEGREPFVAFSIGPKRMDYEKASSIIKSFMEHAP